MKNSISDFINMVQSDCLENGVEIIFHPTTSIMMSKKISVSGFWCDEDKQLNVAIYHPEWLVILAHEYGHYCQWKDGKFIDEKTTEAYILYDEWIEKKISLTKEKLDDICELIQKCELDCEKRALKLVKKYKLCDIESYIQKANSYVLGYDVTKITRKWFKKSPTRVNSIYKSMSKTFTKTLKPTKKQTNLILKNCF